MVENQKCHNYRTDPFRPFSRASFSTGCKVKRAEPESEPFSSPVRTATIVQSETDSIQWPLCFSLLRHSFPKSGGSQQENKLRWCN